MPLFTGKMSVRAFCLQVPMPLDAPAKLRAEAPAVPNTTDPTIGWADVGEIAGYCVAKLRTCSRKIPSSLMKEEVRKHVESMRAHGEPITKHTLKQIKKDVTGLLLPAMPVTFSDIEVMWKPGSRWIYASAISDSQVDLLRAMVATTLNVVPLAYQPIAAAALRKQLDITHWNRLAFAKGTHPETHGLFSEFLTWLWYMAETAHDVAGMKLVVDGPLTLGQDSEKAERIVVKGNNVTLSNEAAAALATGMMLEQAKFAVHVNDLLFWTTATSDWTFRGLDLPGDSKAADPASNFQTRFVQLQDFIEAWSLMFDAFVEWRLAHNCEPVPEVSNWIAGKVGR